jgi:hypothetical protein
MSRFSEDDPSGGGEEIQGKNRDALGKVRRMRLEVEEMQIRGWRKLLGHRLEEMLQSRESSLDAMTDPNNNIREGAFSLFAGYWPPDPALEPVFMQATSSDSDPGVRAAAVSCLVSLYRNSSNKSVCKMLAELAWNDLEPYNIRAIAYLGLLEIQGLQTPNELIRSFGQPLRTLPPELDWAMVRSFLRSS